MSDDDILVSNPLTPKDASMAQIASGEKEDRHSLAQPEPTYSIFTKRQKLSIILLVAFASVYSPLSSFIYYPALSAVADELHTTLSKINLTITSYMIVSGVAPMILGNMADQLGRRPIYLFMFSIFVLANIGLALQTSYPALLILRMLQSAGGSATIGIGYGVLGDITTPSERGAYMGILGCGPNVAPGLGPVLGGVISQMAGWRWIFGFLAIAGALTLVLIAVVLPETARNIVDDGSRPAFGVNKSMLIWLHERNDISAGSTSRSEHVPQIGKLRLPNPMTSISILRCKDTVPIVLVYAVFYTTYSCLQASLSSIFIHRYGYGELKAGLIYIPFGVGCFIGSLLSGKILTNDYNYIATHQGLPVSAKDTSAAQMLAFPIFHARLRSMNYLLPLSTLPLVAYGWVLEYHLHPSIPLILQFIIGGSITIIFNSCGTLVVDLHTLRPSTAQASLNIVRCTFAAGGVAVLQPLINAVGVGWCFTIIAFLTGGAATIFVVIGRLYGDDWKRQRQSPPASEEPGPT